MTEGTDPVPWGKRLLVELCGFDLLGRRIDLRGVVGVIRLIGVPPFIFHHPPFASPHFDLRPPIPNSVEIEPVADRARQFRGGLEGSSEARR
jgi:hypothetical protein